MVHVTHNSSTMKVSVAACPYRQDILARIKEYNLYKETLLEQLKYMEVCAIMFRVVAVCVFVTSTANELPVQCNALYTIHNVHVHSKCLCVYENTFFVVVDH